MSFLVGLVFGVILAYLIPILYIYNLPKNKGKSQSQVDANLAVTLNILTCSCFVNNQPCTIQLHKSTLLMTSMHKSVDINQAKIYYHNDTLLISHQEQLTVIKFLTFEEQWCWYIALIQRSSQYRNSSLSKMCLKLYAHTSMIDPQFEHKDTFLNVFLARQFIAYTTSKYFRENQLNYLSEKFNQKMKSDYFQTIKISHLDYADPPKLQDIKLIGLEEDGSFLAEGLFDYSGLQMVLEVTVNVKVPGFNYFTTSTSTTNMNATNTTNTASNDGFLINLSFNFTLKKLKGKMLLKFPALPNNYCFYGFHPDVLFEVNVEPRVSNRQVKIALLGTLLEKRIL